MLPHVNDFSFWLIGRLLGMSVTEPFKTWSMIKTLIGIVATAPRGERCRRGLLLAGSHTLAPCIQARWHFMVEQKHTQSDHRNITRLPCRRRQGHSPDQFWSPRH
ncbi:GntT/GntP/DsdX family permease [Saccharopolyspora mangrovi]|uniref:Uncharacterized protein n=1 Tax=Saccharopolyspora mangrovi TaxID=3082379 RepID=A0ABU6AJ29_9PSEU|nr:hypothetical protein [Saccharopolyspora sp. S2-29]MEB3371569.1 hypothetical protein [Saccharopolyspora sp. S2-29]